MTTVRVRTGLVSETLEGAVQTLRFLHGLIVSSRSPKLSHLVSPELILSSKRNQWWRLSDMFPDVF